MKCSLISTELQRDYSSPGAAPASWDDVWKLATAAEVYRVTSVRPDGRPHVTPIIAILRDNLAWFCTGVDEIKAHNLAANQHCIVSTTTGTNSMDSGVDIIIEGHVTTTADTTTLEMLVIAYAAKYGWIFTAGDGVLNGDGGDAKVYCLVPTKAFGHSREDGSSTRWLFGELS